jgi:chromosome segregation ATPase
MLPQIKERRVKPIIVGVFFLVLAWCCPLSAKIYKYLDENGNLRFTNDITQVPQDQREQVKSYEEIQGGVTNSETLEKRREAQSQIIEESRSAERAASTEALKARAEKIKERKAALEAQSKVLKDEADALGPPPSRNASNRRLRTYNAKVKELNQKSSAHQQRIKTLESDVNQLTQDAGDQASSLGLEE